MTHLTDEELRALSTLEAGATPAPWTLVREIACYSGESVRLLDGSYQPKHTYYVTRIAELGIVATSFHGESPGDSDPRHVPPDAALIVALRNAVPRLLDEVAALRDFIRRMDTVHGCDPDQLAEAWSAEIGNVLPPEESPKSYSRAEHQAVSDRLRARGIQGAAMLPAAPAKCGTCGGSGHVIAEKCRGTLTLPTEPCPACRGGA